LGFITFSLPGLGQLMSSYDQDNLTLHVQWYLEYGGGGIVLEIDRIIHLVGGQVTSRIFSEILDSATPGVSICFTSKIQSKGGGSYSKSKV